MDNRRDVILKLLKESYEPVTGSTLANKMSVSRQVIVQDIAVLRATGYNIVAGSNGYFIPKFYDATKVIKTIVCKHNDNASMKMELSTMVDLGIKIINVIVEHSVYGELVCPLHLTTLDDVDGFVKNVEESNALPLSALTDGVHIHTLEVPSEKVFEILIKELKDKGIECHS